MRKLNFLAADCHPIVAGGITAVLRNHFNAEVDHAYDSDTIFDLVRKNDYDIVVVDLNMPDTSPQVLLEAVLLQKPKLNLLIFSGNRTEIFARLYLKLGAMGFLSKSATTTELIKAVNCILADSVYIPKSLQEYFIQYGKKNVLNDNIFSLLSRKETEILPHLVKGLSVTEISKMMHLSTSTVGTHKGHIFSKLGVKNMFELKDLIDMGPTK